MKIEKLIVHCSATREGQHITVDTIRDWHVNGRGWKDVGYHYIIYLDGTIKKVQLLCRIDTENEVEYYKNGGILQFVLRNMLA